ncbi:MAG: hypothetical protein WCR63_00065 [Bacilli bacterium]
MEKPKLNIKILSEKEQKAKIEELRRRVRMDPVANKLLLLSPDYELVFKNSYIPLINYLEDKKICEGCKGFSHCPKLGRKGFKIKLSNNYYSLNLEQRYVPCKYYSEILNVLNNIIFSDIDKWEIYFYSNASKEIIKSKPSKVKNSFIFVSKMCLLKTTQYSKSDMNRGYMIYSDNHNGEAIGYLLAYAFARKGNTVSLINAQTTLNKCSSLIEDVKKEGERDLILAKSADIMIINNLGFEYKSQAARDLILTPLFRDRARRGKMTFISSFLDYSDILKMYSRDQVSYKIFKQIIDKIVEPIEVKDLEYFND